MINLLINEYIKTFRRKGFIILLVIMALFSALTNLIYRELGNENIDDYKDQYIVEDYEIAKKEYETGVKNRELKEAYLDAKNAYDLYQFKNKFEKNSWQRAYIERESMASDYISDINNYEYELSTDVDAYNLAKSNYDKLFEKLKNSDWKDMVKEQLTDYQAKLDLINEELSKRTDKKQYVFSMKEMNLLDLSKEQIIEFLPTVDTNSLQGNKLNLEILIERSKIQLEKNISYSDKLMVDLDNYTSVKVQLVRYEGIDINDERFEKEAANEYYQLREQRFKLEYTLNNNISTTDARLSFIIEDFYSEFLLFIVIFIFMVSGPIISQEFGKGTIKMLLVKPYSRTKILLSKYIVTLSSILIAMVAMFVLELITGGLLLGFDSLSDKVVVYSNISDSVSYVNLIKYFVLISIAKLPHFIILATLVFSMSSITNNTTVSMIIGFVAYVGTNLITALLIGIDKPWAKYFIGFNWDFKPYMFNCRPTISGINFEFSVLICLLYFLVLIIPAFIVFKHKDIKNI